MTSVYMALIEERGKVDIMIVNTYCSNNSLEVPQNRKYKLPSIGVHDSCYDGSYLHTIIL